MQTGRDRLATVAEELALRPFHGRMLGLRSNLKPITDRFPDGPRSDFDRIWCAAFVYHCCREAGFEIPYRYPADGYGTFAGVRTWLRWAKLPTNRFYFSARHPRLSPARGDIVVYDGVFDPGPHDHVGVVVAVSADSIRVAEGNVNDVSSVLVRPRDRHVRGYIRLPSE